ncbi:MAG: CotH kinase family protein [Oscillibacter sp.]|nr:CotH kinase family protein [Oscillibacter sp.]
MSTHKNLDRISIAVLTLSLLLTALFMNGAALGLESASHGLGYEKRLFDTSKVHSLSIVIDDWDGFLDTCENEEYASCSVVIDNENYKNVGLRAKGNTSLTTVRSMDSDRYSMKIEFDHYESGKTYHGLDKLCLNNVIQDNTYMKDYLTYRMMGEFGVHAPLCSYVWITVNGQDWGLYLAVEGVEDSFLQRNYGNDYGELYKPDSQSFGGGGPGRGRDFRMSEFMNELNGESGTDNTETRTGQREMAQNNAVSTGNGVPFPPGNGFPSPPDTDAAGNGFPSPPDMDATGNGFPNRGNMRGMGSDDVKLKYSDDNADSYGSIFENAKTNVTAADKSRLIASLKSLGERESLESVLDMETVLRYFVVHNYVVNGDSYTGSMIHNYYLYEKDGQLSMIPWDYNLAFGGFQGGSASGSVNDPIDTPLSVSGDGDRPMADWFVQQDDYTELYHQYFREFLDSVDVSGLIDTTRALIAPYVERDPTKFCTYEEFETGAETLRTFCGLRTESVRGQLEGSIPATDEAQLEDSSALIDASSLTLSDMGSMNRGGGFRDGFHRTRAAGTEASDGTGESPASPDGTAASGVTRPAFPGSTSAEASDGTDESPAFPDGAAASGVTRPAFPDGQRGPGSASGPSALSREIWMLLGVSCAVLCAGLLAAARPFHRKYRN